MRLFSIALAAAAVAALSQTAVAADLGARTARSAPVMAPVAVSSWSGCFVGVNGGYATAPTDWTVTGTSIAAGSHDATGGVVGGQIGCDLQTGNFVIGIEGLMDWADLSGSHNFGGVHFETDTNWLATVTGRAGIALDRTLLYVRGGAAFINNDFAFSALGVRPTGDETQTGWTVGVGAEWAFTPGWSARVEYNYMDFGGVTPTFCARGICGTALDIDQVVHSVTVGLNYRFH
jgi:outer membrane immunogenic protein